MAMTDHISRTHIFEIVSIVAPSVIANPQTIIMALATYRDLHFVSGHQYKLQVEELARTKNTVRTLIKQERYNPIIGSRIWLSAFYTWHGPAKLFSFVIFSR